MAASTEHDAFVARCLRVAQVAQQAGVALAKVDAPYGVAITKDGASVSFPIVSDDRLWRQTSVEEAFYAVLVDARAWAGADVRDSIVVTMTDEVEKGEVELIKRDLADERARVDRLTEMLGGADVLARLYATADLA